jgi:hypothetical protein
LSFDVVDVERHRVDRLLVARKPEVPPTRLGEWDEVSRKHTFPYRHERAGHDARRVHRFVLAAAALAWLALVIAVTARAAPAFGAARRHASECIEGLEAPLDRELCCEWVPVTRTAFHAVRLRDSINSVYQAR